MGGAKQEGWKEQTVEVHLYVMGDCRPRRASYATLVNPTGGSFLRSVSSNPRLPGLGGEARSFSSLNAVLSAIPTSDAAR